MFVLMLVLLYTSLFFFYAAEPHICSLAILHLITLVTIQKSVLLQSEDDVHTSDIFISIQQPTSYYIKVHMNPSFIYSFTGTPPTCLGL